MEDSEKLEKTVKLLIDNFKEKTKLDVEYEMSKPRLTFDIIVKCNGKKIEAQKIGLVEFIYMINDGQAERIFK